MFGMTKSFYYLPIPEKVPFIFERAVQIFFWPMNSLDQLLFEAPWPCGPLDTEFSGRAKWDKETSRVGRTAQGSDWGTSVGNFPLGTSRWELPLGSDLIFGFRKRKQMSHSIPEQAANLRF
jgi:hypothetical protein